MTVRAKIIADSISEAGDRLTTFELQFHRFILAEMNTHRLFSRNSASSRAVPVHKQIERVETDPALPVAYMYNQPGMQASEPMTPEDEAEAEKIILDIRDAVVDGVKKLNELGPIDPETGKALGLHKQWANRYLEPFQWHTAIISSTEWENFFAQRATVKSPLGQPEIRAVTDLMVPLLEESVPQLLTEGQWHLPYIQDDEWDLDVEVLKELSAARCARVSYLTHDGKRSPEADMKLFERLAGARPPHASPLEHVATPDPENFSYVELKDESGEIVWKGRTPRLGNFIGWSQLRHRVGMP